MTNTTITYFLESTISSDIHTIIFYKSDDEQYCEIINKADNPIYWSVNMATYEAVIQMLKFVR